MFGAVVMLLQAETAAGLDAYALDLKTFTGVYTVIPTLGTCYFRVLRSLRGSQPFQFRHY